MKKDIVLRSNRKKTGPSKWLLSLLMLLCMHSFAFGQEVTITGKVTTVTNEPLPGVSIGIMGTTQGTITDIDGIYQLKANKGDEVGFTFIGFVSQNIVVGDLSEINIILEEDVASLDEVIVVGYGKQSRATLSTAISKVDTKELEQTTYSNATSALQGRVAGLRVQNTSGQPGATPRVVLRGGTSIDNYEDAQPLYIVDGVIRANMLDINTEDIETIQVLKDAASTAVYGARASNGVVILTTKKGSRGTGKVSYSGSLTLSQTRLRNDLLSAEEYIKFGRLGVQATSSVPGNESRISRLDLAVGYGVGNDLTNNTQFTPQYLTDDNRYKLNEGWQSMVDPIDPSKTIIFDNTDWQDELFQTGIRQNHHVSFSGGDEKGTFNLSLGYLDEKGVTIHTGYKRYSGMLNADRQVLEKLRVFGKAEFAHTKTEGAYNTRHLFQRSLSLPASAKFRHEDGTLAAGQNSSLGNPVYYMDKFMRDRQKNRTTLLVGAEWDITDELSFKPQGSLYSLGNYENDFNEAYRHGTSYRTSRDARGEHEMEWNKQFDAVLSYVKSFNKHNVNATAVATYNSEYYYQLEAKGKNAATDNIPTLNGSAEPVAVKSQATKQVVVGYVGRVAYDFDKRFLVGASIRRDGASNVGKSNYWGTFPGVSVGWNLHNEEFFKSSPVSALVNNFKVRMSYGTTGNNSGLNPYTPQGNYDASRKYNGSSAIRNTSLANYDLQWETTTTFDAGFDLGMFNNRVHLLFDYYNKETQDLITDYALPTSSGFTSVKTNLGTFQNRGIEIELAATPVMNDNFTWDVSANFNYNKNTILSLPENGTPNNRIGGFYIYDANHPEGYSWQGGLQEGGTIGEMYAFVQEGIFVDDAAAATGPYDSMVKNPGVKFGGDVDWLDADGNGTIDPKDKRYMGNALPPYTGGISNTFRYKGLSMRIFMDYALGHTIYYYTKSIQDGQYQGDINATTDILNSWQQPGDVTDVPRYYWADQLAQSNYWRGNSKHFYDGDYLCLREISLSYSLPKRVTDFLRVSKLDMYFTGQNLFYFTNYPGFQPEGGEFIKVNQLDRALDTPGVDQSQYPVPRMYSFGVNLTF